MNRTTDFLNRGENTFRLILTEDCNANCPHCFNANMREDKHMSMETFYRAISYIDAPAVKLMGGEPTLHPFLNEIIDACHDAFDTVRMFTNGLKKDILEPMLPVIPHLKEPFKYIGLNTPGEPDLLISYILPESAMDLVKLHHYHFGKNLDVSLCSMMPICSGIAVRAYLEEKMTLSFACEDSRQYGQIDRNRLAVGIPKKLFPVFAN